MKSGPKQHFIPQSLLKGFASAQSGSAARVIVYERGKKPYPASTADVAAQRFFYSERAPDGVQTVDDLITRHETPLAATLVEFRGLSPFAPVDSKRAAELVAHLTTRPAFPRDLFRHGAADLLEATAQRFSSPQWARKLLGLDTNQPSEAISTALDEFAAKLKTRALIKLPAPILRRMGFALFREGFDRSFDQLAPQITMALGNLKQGLPEVLRRGQAKALAVSLTPPLHVAILERFQWRVAHYPGRELLLPDCVAIALGNGGASISSYMANDFDALDAVFLPLSAERLLIGAAAELEVPSVEIFNRNAASCSIRFFVGAQDTPRNAELAGLIGELPLAKVSAALREALEDIPPANPLTGSEPQAQANQRSTVIGAPNSSFHFSITFRFWESQESADKIGAAIGAIVREIHGHISLERLDSIIVGDDYDEALGTLDRGIANLEPVQSIPAAYGIGVAKAVLVMRDGILKCALVLQGGLARLLIDDAQNSDLAVHTLVNTLCQVGFLGTFERTLPGALQAPLPDYIEALQFQQMYDASLAYFAAFYSAAFSNDASEICRSNLVASLTHAMEELPKERIAYRQHGDLSKFLNIATAATGRIMMAAGSLMGHCQALGLPLDDEAGRLSSLLCEHSLDAWVALLHRDLNALFTSRGGWTSIRDFVDVNTHSERLLWRFGVYPWKTDDGLVRAEIPLEIDSEALRKLRPRWWGLCRSRRGSLS